MGKLADLLEVGTPEPNYAPSFGVDGPGGRALTVSLEGDHDASTDAELLRALGHDPDHWSFAVPPAVYRKVLEDGTVKFTNYRYKLEPRSDARGGGDDGSALAARILARSARRTPYPNPTGAAFNFQASDLQLGKSDNGGTEAIVDRFLDSVEIAVGKLEQARVHRSIPLVHIMFPGDCIEGNQSQSGRNMWRTELTVTEQTRVFRALMYRTIEAFADIADRVYVDVVNGNHDEVQRFQTTRPDDGHATESALAVREGLALNGDAFGHVEVRVPPVDQGYMTVPVGDTVFTIAHGHQWRRGKAMDWWKGQTFYGHNAGGAHLLVHGHFHEFETERAGARMRICSPTYDQGSNYYREMTGAVSPPGGLVYVTGGGEFSDLSIV
ncbi:exonuclease [Gordonia phage Catfish]|uniref:MRE11 double-strand break endo/exonuclease n=1 Tax=Gordonia phage Catfish TaxID=2301538 RepID=A0A385D0M3_9CAUD|nr:exonuclease [Gordonia phage Catfish]AXQ51902.1 MRE11 double-strand break endo/exonuclease [Gordonia phage Catfish]